MKKKKIIIVASVVGTLGLAIGLGSYFLLKENSKNNETKKPVVNIKKDLKIEVYSPLPNIEDFGLKEGKIVYKKISTEKITCDENESECVEKEVITEPGEYEVIITVDGIEYKQTFQVADTINPNLELKEVTITEGEKYDTNTFIQIAEDNSKKQVKISFEDENMASIKDIGEHIIKIVAEDESGNKTIKETKLTINKKKEEIKIPTNNSSSGSSNNKQNNNTSSNTSSSNNNSSANNNYQYSDNIVVQRALSLVGKTSMVCDDVVEYAIKGVGKEYITYHEVTDRWCSNNAGTTLGVDDPAMYSDHSWESTPKIIVNGYTLYKYYSNNNILYKVEGYKDGVWEDVSNTFPSVGQAAYSNCGGMTYSNPVLIFSTDQVMQVSLNSIQPGDILKYANGGNGTGHVAIYIGDGKAVHGGIGQSNDVQIMTMYPPGASTPVAYRIK